MEQKLEQNILVTGDQVLLEAFLQKAKTIGYSLIEKVAGMDTFSCLAFYPIGEGEVQRLHLTPSFDNRLQYKLPQQWEVALEAISKKFPKVEELKVGDWVVFKHGLASVRWGKITRFTESTTFYYNLPGKRERTSSSNPEDYKKLSLEEIRQTLLKEINHPGDNSLLSLEADGDLRLYINDMLRWTSDKGWLTSAVFGDYKASYKRNKVHFGCQSFTKEEVQFIGRLVASDINALIQIKGKTVTPSVIKEILQMME